MWYIEWYSESPYEISVLYWCVRLLQVATYHTRKPERDLAIQDLYDTHGIVIMIRKMLFTTFVLNENRYT